MADVARVLPEVGRLRQLCRAFAVLDIIVQPDAHWPRGDRFEPQWAPGFDAAVSDGGGGDGYFVAFHASGVLVLGFDHESVMSPHSFHPLQVWPGLIDQVPDDLAAVLHQLPDFMNDIVPMVTACAWRCPQDTAWQVGDVAFPDYQLGTGSPDGSGWLFELLVDPDPAAVAERWQLAAEPQVIEAVAKLLDAQPLTAAMAVLLNPNCDPVVVRREVEPIGLPFL